MNPVKIFILLVLFMLPVKIVLAQEMLAFLDGTLSFQRPPGVTLWEERPNMSDPNHQNFWRERIQLAINIYDEQALRSESPTMMNRVVYDLAYSNELIPREIFLGLFTENSEFVIFPFRPRVNVRKSYKQLVHYGVTIGESFFHANALNLEARGNFGYTTSVIVENRIVNIYLSLFTGEENNPLRQLDGYTVTRGSHLFWRDDRAQVSFYEHLSSDRYKEMPLIFQQLREAYEVILQTLRIRQGDSYISSINVISPSLEFQRTHITTRELRLQERVDEHSPTILVLSEGTDVQVIRVSEFMGTRIGVPFPWVIVTTREGIVGWVFSGYLTSVEDFYESTLMQDDSSVIRVDQASVMDGNNELMPNNAEDIVVSRSGRVALWQFLLLLMLLIFGVISFVKKVRK
jgi:hypothetical protein